MKIIQDEFSEKTSEEVFLSSPGAKTFHYAFNASPERVFDMYGPLDAKLMQKPPIVGETKKQYYTRIIKIKLDKKFNGDRESKEYKEAFEIAKEVINEYCSDKSAFAMIDVKKILNVPMQNSILIMDDLR